MALHIIGVVCWFAGLFYLPRLYVYHTQALAENDERGHERFKIMEKKLFRFIMNPSGMAATLFGLLIISSNADYYMKQGWLHVKLTLVILLWAYHIYCKKILVALSHGNNPHTEKFYRIFNEIPAVILVVVVLLVVIKPF